MNKILPYLVLFLVLGAALVVGVYYASFPSTRAEVMGTWVEVKGKSASAAIGEIKRLESLFSRFNSSSEVSLINQAAGKNTVFVSKDTFRVIEQACEVSELSKGAFDITLGERGNYREVILDKEKGKIGLRHPGMKIDLGGIGKGYAADSARRVLLSKGTLKAMVDMHSSIAVLGGPWRIGIRDPQKKGQALGVVELNDGDALSTSAQYEQPEHIIDPRTGRPADKCLSVTVIGNDAGLVDALSTAIFVLGPREGMKLAKQMKAKAVIVDKKGIIYDNFGFKLR